MWEHFPQISPKIAEDSHILTVKNYRNFTQPKISAFLRAGNLFVENLSLYDKKMF